MTLSNNGITILCENVPFGHSTKINNVTYTKRKAEEITKNNASSTCTSGITNMTKLFYGQPNNEINRNNYGINHWDVSNVTIMDSLFGASDFNENLSAWDVSNVESMSGLFQSTTITNVDFMQSWDLSKVTDISKMFMRVENFDGDISSWDVSKIINMSWLFHGANMFNQDLSNWDVSSVNDMSYMFPGLYILIKIFHDGMYLMSLILVVCFIVHLSSMLIYRVGR